MVDDGDIWDAKKLISEYVNNSWIFKKGVNEKDLIWSDQIHIQRMATLICAFLDNYYIPSESMSIIKSLFVKVDNYDFFCQDLTAKREEKLEYKIRDLTNNCSSIDRIFKEIHDKERNGRYNHFRFRVDTFNDLLEFRISAEKLIHPDVYILEGSIGTSLASNINKILYNQFIDSTNAKIDDLLILLLGEKFDKTFTKQELVENYSFPTAKDIDLLHYDLDNL